MAGTGRKYRDLTKTKKRWLILLALFFVSFLENGVIRSFALILDDIAIEFDVSAAYVGSVLGLVFGTAYWLAFVNNALLRHFSVRQLVMLGGALSTIGLVGSSLTKSACQFSTALAVYGLGYTLIAHPTNICPLRYFPDQILIATSIMVSGGSAGVMLMPLLFESLLMMSYGWRGSVLILGGLFSQQMVIGALLEPTGKSVSLPGMKKDDSLSSSTRKRKAMTEFPTPEKECTYEDGSKIAAVDRQTEASEAVCGFTGIKNIGTNQVTSNLFAFTNTFVEDEILKTDELSNNETECKSHIPDDGHINLHGSGFMSSEEMGEIPKSSFTVATADGMGRTAEQDINQQKCTVDCAEVRKIAFPGRQCNTPDTSEAPVIFSSMSCAVTNEADGSSCIANCMLKLLRAPARTLGFRIFSQHPLMMVVFLQSFFFSLSNSGWLLYIIPNALAKGLSPLQAVYISMAGGLFNFFGRLGIGFVWSKRCIRFDVGYSAICVCLAIAFSTNFFADTFVFLVILSSFYGLFIGALISSQFQFVLNTVGDENYSTGISMIAIGRGLSGVVTGALFGLVYDRTESYNISFGIISGLFILVASLNIAPSCMACLRRKSSENQVAKESLS